jgi:hypothetical protein
MKGHRQDQTTGGGLRRAALAVLCSSLPFMGAAVRAHDFGDDYGDAPANAFPLNLNSNCSGRIEIDTDQDWFSFNASPLFKYTITVTTGTLWNSTLAAVASDAQTSLSATDSVRVAPSRVSWIHFGPPATDYVGVGGFAQFTTGTYSIVVSQSNFTDLNHNGMDDEWEMAQFGNTNQPSSGDFDGDGFSNLDEFLAGTSPKGPLSRFIINDVTANTNGSAVACQVVPYRCYRLQVSTNLMTDAWQPLGLVTNLQFTGSMVFPDTSPPVTAPRYYRILCVF